MSAAVVVESEQCSKCNDCEYIHASMPDRRGEVSRVVGLPINGKPVAGSTI